MGPVTADARRTADRAAHSRTVDRAGRLGFLARALLYVVSAALTLQIALGGRGQEPGAQGAIQTLAGNAFGTVLLGVLAVGLAGYAVLRLSQVWTNPGDEGGLKGLGHRAAYLVRGVAYGFVTYLTVRQLTGGGGGGNGEQALTARLLELPGGPWLVAAAGLTLAGLGVYQVVRGATRGFEDDLRGGLSGPERRWAVGAGVAGYLGRGALMLIAAWFLVGAAVERDPEQAGLDAALQRLVQEPYGPPLLLAAALGLALFAIWCVVLARYGDVKDSD